MTPARFARPLEFVLIRLLPALALGLLSGAAAAQADPPGRVASINYAEGSVVFSPTGDNEWTDARLNRPLVRGDRLWTDRGSRAEVQVGSAALRMDGQTHLGVSVVDDQSSQMSVTQGTVHARVRHLYERENFEIDTPNLAFRASQPGDYRIDVDSARGTTRVTVHSGTAVVFGAGGDALQLAGGQQVAFRNRNLTQLTAQESPPQDNFDRWAAERNRREDQSISARYLSRDVGGYQLLDAHGQWSQDATHGVVWYPYVTLANWAPYRYGHWEWIGPWGWTWIDDAPWGFAPSHYGRWALVGTRWAWVPGRIGARPVYAPALVAFVGGSNAGVNWSVLVGSGHSGVAWFPLAPGEAWRPGFEASPAYINNVNRHLAVGPPVNGVLQHQRREQALTAVSAEDFHRGRPVRGGQRLGLIEIARAQVVPPPSMPERSGVLDRQRPAVARVVPPAAVARPLLAANPVQAAAAGSQLSARGGSVATPPPPQITGKPTAVAASAATAPTKVNAAIVSAVLVAAKPTAMPAAVAASAAAAPSAAAHKAAKVVSASIAPPPRASPVPTRSDAVALRQQQGQREQARRLDQEARARRDHQLKQQTLAIRQAQAKRDLLAQREAQTKRADRAGRFEQDRKLAQGRRESHASRADQAHRAERIRRDAQVQHEALIRQRQQAQAQRDGMTNREAQSQRETQEREQAQREAWQRQQQTISEQWRRDHQSWQEQQRAKARNQQVSPFFYGPERDERGRLRDDQRS